MPNSRIWTSLPQRAKRLALLALGVGVFALAARTLQPAASTAAPGIPLANAAGEKVAPTASEGRQLGELLGQGFRLLVHSSPEGPRYTVISPAGVVLAENRSEQDITREFPGLQIETMTADAPSDHLHSPDW